MDLYYKVEKESNTGVAFMEIMDRLDKFNEKALAVMKKYGIRNIMRIGWDLCGVHTCKFNTPPDATDWKKVEDGYMPRVRSKNKELLSDFKELSKMTIKRSEIDVLLGKRNPFCQAGYEVFDDCIVFITSDTDKPRCRDANPISNLEYQKMRDTKKRNKEIENEKEMD